MENLEQVEKWFEIYGDFNYEPELKFEDLKTKLHPCEQVSAIMFLASKLKDKTEKFFLHGENGVIYIGSSFDIFEDFTEEDVKIAVAHNITFASDGDGFEIYASM